MSRSETLVLNRHFYAIQICDWKKSLSLVYQGHAQAVDGDGIVYGYDDWVIYTALNRDDNRRVVHTPNLALQVPDVIRLTRYDRLPKGDVKFTRRNMYQHYGNICAYCGHKYPSGQLNMDHVMPKSRGGSISWKNIVPSCLECNTRKGNRTPKEAQMPLLYQPSKPSWRGHQDVIAKTTDVCQDAWSKFIDKGLWDQKPEE